MQVKRPTDTRTGGETVKARLETGTKIEVRGWNFRNEETWEPAVIGRTTPDELRGMPDDGRGWYVVGDMMVHESRFRVVS